jgi:thioredoxin-related protein
MLKTICLVFLSSILSTIVSANDSFILHSLTEANRLSATTKKPVLLIFGSESCRYCNMLKKDILIYELSPSIDKYIVCYIDTDKNPEFKNKYNVSVIPDSRILSHNKEIRKNKGYSKYKYIKWLNNE